ncbi:hypothetical protein [Psychromicrobium lacuslunae]|uniref:hypothetical protein n=1 Tax=Psychromicrobium lacuslunae TaxID=1618207 RepID=UPI0006965721|nr:hypothetical protein [Psychromicrobium lacuslunae]
MSYSYPDAEAAAEQIAPETTPKSLPITKSLARNINWKLLNKASGEVLGEGITDPSSAAFEACFDASLSSSAVKVQFESARSGLWRTVKANDAAATTYTNDHNLEGQNFGALEVPEDQAAAFKIVDTLSSLWAKRANSSSACWAAFESPGQCKPLTFAWGSAIDNDKDEGGKDTGYWDYRGPDSGSKYVVVGSNSIRSKHTIVHEAGHAWQEMLNGSFPVVTNCAEHTHAKATSTSCAWTEGWADAVAAWALGDTRYVFDDGKYIDLVGHPEWQQGAAVQGRVAAALLQLWAGPDAGSWDKTISLMTGKVVSCFSEYYQARPAAGLANTAAVEKILTDNSLDPQSVADCG